MTSDTKNVVYFYRYTQQDDRESVQCTHFRLNDLASRDANNKYKTAYGFQFVILNRRICRIVFRATILGIWNHKVFVEEF